MKTKRYLLLLFPLLLLAAGCAPDCKPEDYDGFFLTLDSPVNGALVPYDGPVNLDWNHNAACKPEGYEITVKDLASGITKDWQLGIEDTDFGLSSEYMDFKPDRSYEWSIRAYGTVDDEDGWRVIFGPSSVTETFHTDGLCASEDLLAPILHFPPDGAWTNPVAFPGKSRLIWEYPDTDCWPAYYHYELAADPEFENMITTGIREFSSGKNYSSLAYRLGLNNKNIEELLVDTPECARIYWRVEARLNNNTSALSETYRFTKAVDSGCWQNQTSIDAALIKGFVFKDFCETTIPYVPENVGIFPPCTFDEIYGVHADGNRARGENAELGIPGIVVDLGSGPCPSTGMDQFITSENGAYFFMVQSPGEYCVSVNRTKNPILWNGMWTLPLTDLYTTGQTINMPQGTTKATQNFGWDQYDYLNIDFMVNLTSVCRAGDNTKYPEIAYANEGDLIPIFARNEESTWFAALVDGRRCFISIASGEPQEDPEGLMIYPKLPPPPEPEPAPSPMPGTRTKSCSAYKTEQNCIANSCNWVYTLMGLGYCRNP